MCVYIYIYIYIHIHAQTFGIKDGPKVGDLPPDCEKEALGDRWLMVIINNHRDDDTSNND